MAGEEGVNIKDIYRTLEQTLLLAQAANIRLGLTGIPLQPGPEPGKKELDEEGNGDEKPMDEEDQAA